MNSTLKKSFTQVACAAALLSFGAPVLALDNFNNWTALGDVLANSSTSATLSTANFGIVGETTVSGQDALYIDDLELGLSLASGALGSDAFEGSGLFRSFSIALPTTLSFNWTLSTVGFDPAFADRAFVAINGVAQTLATVAATPVNGSFSHSFLSAGNYTFSFGLVDVDDVAGLSTLAISGLNVAVVPEPASYALLLAGLAVVAGAARRRRSAAAR